MKAPPAFWRMLLKKGKEKLNHEQIVKSRMTISIEQGNESNDSKMEINQYLSMN